MPYVFDPAAPESNTPLMKQYLKLKAEAPGSILFFRMGDFYEVFGPDAEAAAPILGVTLTARDKRSDNPIPMAGVPFHSANGYIQKLLAAGKKVSIAEQMQDPDSVKGLVDRQIVRTFTPAVNFDLSASVGFMATVQPEATKASGSSSAQPTYSIVLLEPATGLCRVAFGWSENDLIDLLSPQSQSSVKHWLISHPQTPHRWVQQLDQAQDSGAQVLVEEVPSNSIADSAVKTFLLEQFSEGSEKRAALPMILEDQPAAQKALAHLIQYILKSQKIERLHQLEEPQPLQSASQLVLGPNTWSHLDLEELFTWINRTATSMGSRQLRQRLEQPLTQIDEIEKQQAAVRALVENSLESAQISQQLRAVYDLDRLLGRISAKLANPRDSWALATSLQSALRIALPETATAQSVALQEIQSALTAARTALSPLVEKVLRIQKSDAPLHTRDAGIFELGTDPELDRLIRLTTEGEKFLVDLEQREREATGIGSLKVKYNKVFGYFIEISSANLKLVPSHYQRKQTMVGAERFFTEELKKFEEEILTASSKQRALETKLFEALLDEWIAVALSLKQVSQSIGKLDATLAMAQIAQQPGWCFPEIDESFDLNLEGARHPVVDDALGGKFVANDIQMNPRDSRTLLITGPNMGGKSTLMRQVAQILILGQMGSPVPARSARFGVIHSLYTRIGAHDAIAKGQSTFMVEMVELAHILRHANARSFVVLDEVGRGTATFDGMSVAWAALEHLHLKSQARILFATHYHELTELERQLPGLKNAYMKVEESKKERLLFLYELALGKSSKSFGVQVAELAGVPRPVIQKAWTVLRKLEAEPKGGKLDQLDQPSLFDAAVSPVYDTHAVQQCRTPEAEPEWLAELGALELDQMRPLEALQILDRWKRQYGPQGTSKSSPLV